MGMSPILAWLPDHRRATQEGTVEDDDEKQKTPWSRELFTNELKSFWGTLPNPEDGAISRIIWVSYQCEVRGLISMFSIQPVFVSPLFLCPVSSLQCMQKRIFTAPDGIRYPESFVALPWFFCDHRWIRIYSLNQSIWVTLHVEPGHCEEISRPKTFDSEACQNIWLKVSPLSSRQSESDIPWIFGTSGFQEVTLHSNNLLNCSLKNAIVFFLKWIRGANMVFTEVNGFIHPDSQVIWGFGKRFFGPAVPGSTSPRSLWWLDVTGDL